MNIEEEREKIGRFIRAGLFGLSLVLLIGCGILYIPNAIATFHAVEEEEKMPIHSVDCLDKQLAFTFDVCGTDDNVQDILNVLSSHSIKATFFLTGKWAEENPELAASIYQAGHDLGNSSENHKDLTEVSAVECQEEITTAHNEIKEITGADMKLFRAPFGSYNDTVMEVSENLGYYPIEWDVDSLDWKDYGIDSIVNEICNNQELKNGSIILLHCGTKFTEDALDEVICSLQKQGYSFVTVTELIYEDDYYIDKNGRQIASLTE